MIEMLEINHSNKVFERGRLSRVGVHNQIHQIHVLKTPGIVQY